MEATGPTGAVVTFGVTATDDGGGVPVTCSATSGATFAVNAVDLVDGAIPVQCTPASGSRFSTGYTLVRCSPTDSHNNTATTQFYVVVTEMTPTQLIANLYQVVGVSSVDPNSVAKLRNMLNTVTASLAKSNGAAGVTAAKNQLGAFQNQVKALANSKRISTADANALIAAAGRIIAGL